MISPWQEGAQLSARRGRVPSCFFKFREKKKFSKNAPCQSLERAIIEASKTTKPHLITEIKMDISKVNEILKTIEKRGPFFAFDEIDKNKRAREHFFNLQYIDNKIGKRCVAFINAKTYSERCREWSWLLTHFDEFRATLSTMNSYIEGDDARALIGEIWGDCCDLSFEAKKQTPNKTRCLLLNNQSNMSWLLIRCCTKDVLTYYQGKLDKAWQDVLKDDE